MRDSQLFDILREALWSSLVVSFPMLAAALVTGLAIGLFQALTSIQEMTLTFVPKLLVMVCVFWVTMNGMTQVLVDFFQTTLIPATLEV